MWHYLDLAIIVTGACVVIFKMVSTKEIEKHITSEALQTVQTDVTSRQINFREIAKLHMSWETALAILVFFSWLKVYFTNVMLMRSTEVSNALFAVFADLIK
jgi:hypothetical protein